jgi:hypothetical protein
MNPHVSLTDVMIDFKKRYTKNRKIILVGQTSPANFFNKKVIFFNQKQLLM